MSNYTTSETLFQNKHLLPRIGLDDEESHNEKYVNQQHGLINQNKKLLPPTIEYPGMNLEDKKKDKNFRVVPPGTRLSTHEPLDRDRFDPHVGYLHKKGLLGDSGVLRYNIHCININSANRNLLPIMKIDDTYDLQPNPLNFTNGSNLLQILQSDHEFQVNDRITLTGVLTPVITLRNKVVSGSTIQLGFELTSGSDLMKINYTHQIPETYTGTDIRVLTSGINGNTASAATTNSYFDNIPVNLLNKTHIYLPADIALNTIYNPNTDGSVFDPNSFYVQLNKPYIGAFDVSVLSPYNFTIKFTTIAGISLNEINAEYPIDIDHLNGFHTIKTISNFGYTVELLSTAVFSSALIGGSNVQIGKVSDIIDGYPNPNNYTMRLGNTFHNVIGARLISSEFPNTRMAIRNFPENTKNNVLHWNNFDDGDYLYSVEIEPGNYTPDELVTLLESKFLALNRVNYDVDNGATSTTSTPPYTNKNIINVDIDTNTNIVTFQSKREAILNRPIIGTIPAITVNTNGNDFNDTLVLIINHPNHGLNVGDEITLSNSIAQFGIPITAVNTVHIITRVTDENTYRITLETVNISTGGTDTGGGIAVNISSPNLFRLRFDQEYTVGGLLGFRNVGSSTAIYEYASIIRNKDKYEFEQTVNSLGESIEIRQNFIQLSGDDYFLMTTDKLENFTSTGPIKTAFAKIILCDIPGKTLYNSFVNSYKIRKRQLPQLSELTFKFYAPDGTLFDFQNINHSFTLEITTVQELPKGTNISGKTGRGNFQGIAK
jgi:hypothetical protein